ncbi:alcohol dehydrogenase catalytic domain-containing protein [Arthrobacter sp. RAF14]|uniref:alcohol dehydrogenase catalytic domain-containing protein n=1 Tax=Arthrobacter sp. RAF14 TaxID=3233051 RepID=UPI003F931133
MAVTAGSDPVITRTSVPDPGPGEVLVRIKAASVNPTDVMTWRRGRFPTGETTPMVGGYDLAGEVVSIGRGVTILQPGDAVAGMPRFPHPAGAFADFTTAPARHLAKVPAGGPGAAEPDWGRLAALPLAGSRHGRPWWTPPGSRRTTRF